MKRIIIYVFIFLITPFAYAAGLPGLETPSYSSLGYDRKDTSPRWDIVQDYPVAQSDNDWGARYILACLSVSSTENGACPSRGADNNQEQPGQTEIMLQFTEKKSLVKRNLKILASRRSISGYPLLINSTSGFDNYREYKLNLLIETGEINKLPFGGVWEAKLKLRAGQYGRYDVTQYDRLEVNLSIDLKDSANVQVWFPEFLGNGEPQLDLNMKPTGVGNRFIGKNSLDMCLYDGYSTNYSHFQLTLMENTPSGTISNEFLLRHLNDTSKTLPYSVSVSFPKNENPIQLVKNVTVPISSSGLHVNWNRIVSVSAGAPDISVPVLCWPAKLNFSSDVQNPASGSYSGKLSLVFTVSP